MKRWFVVFLWILPNVAFAQVFAGVGGGYFYNIDSAIRERFESGAPVSSFEFGYRTGSATFFWRQNRPSDMKGYAPRYYQTGAEFRVLPRTFFGAGFGYLTFTETTGLRQRSVGLFTSLAVEFAVRRARIGWRVAYDAHGVDRDDMPKSMENVGGVSFLGYLRVMIF
jgi:hypothetical protein